MIQVFFDFSIVQTLKLIYGDEKNRYKIEI